MFTHKLKFIVLPQLIATLNNYACHCLYWLMLTGLLYQNAFCRSCKSATGEMAPKEGSKLVVGTWYSSHCQCTSACLGLVVDWISALCGCMYTSWLLWTLATISVFLFLCLSFCHYPPHIHTPPAYPQIYTGPIFEFELEFKYWAGSKADVCAQGHSPKICNNNNYI